MWVPYVCATPMTETTDTVTPPSAHPIAAMLPRRGLARVAGPDWSAPPDGVLEAVAQALLPAQAAVLRRVCCGWRAAHGRVITRLAPADKAQPVPRDALTHACRHQFPNLRALDLSGCRIQAAELVAGLEAAAPASLTELRLGDCDSLAGDDLRRIAGALPSLTRLSLPRCSGIASADLRHVSCLTALQHLDLSYCDSIDAGGFAHLGQLPQLEELLLADCEGVGDDALTCLASTPASKSLRLVDLTGCSSITDRGVAQGLATCRCLEIARLKCCESVGDGAVAALAAGCPRLRCLDLGWCNIGDSSLRSLAASLPDLETLNLSWCEQVTNQGLAWLSRLRKLTALKMKGCVLITDAGLGRLSSLTTLRSLNLRLCVQASPAGLAGLETCLRKQRLSSFTCSTAAPLFVRIRPPADAAAVGDHHSIVVEPQQPLASPALAASATGVPVS